MSDKVVDFTVRGDRKQEIIMRDVMGGLEEIATILAYDPWPGDFEIVAIHSPGQEDTPPREEVVLRSRKPQPQAEVISYAEHKRLKRRA